MYVIVTLVPEWLNITNNVFLSYMYYRHIVRTCTHIKVLFINIDEAILYLVSHMYDCTLRSNFSKVAM